MFERTFLLSKYLPNIKNIFSYIEETQRIVNPRYPCPKYIDRTFPEPIVIIQNLLGDGLQQLMREGRIFHASLVGVRFHPFHDACSADKDLPTH